MNRFTTTQCVIVIQLFSRNNCVQTLNGKIMISQFNRPTGRTIRKMVQKCEKTGFIGDRIRHVHHRGERSAENIAAVSDSVVEDPELPIRRRSHTLGLSFIFLWAISYKDLHLHPYRIQVTLQLKPRGEQRRIHAYLHMIDKTPFHAQKFTV